MSPLVSSTAKAAPLLSTKCGAPRDPIRPCGLAYQTRMARGYFYGFQPEGASAPHHRMEHTFVVHCHAIGGEAFTSVPSALSAVPDLGAVNGPSHFVDAG